MKILLAEDERELSSALCAILTYHHYTVDAVYDGQEALDYLQNGNYDATVLDIMMPGMDGLSVLRHIRDKGNRIPVLLISAKAEVSDRVLGLDSGADDYLTKPFDTQELLARIRAIIRRQPMVSDTMLRVGNLCLDRTKYELVTEKGRMSVSNKEYQIIELLMTNPGQFFSTEYILQKIWGYDTETEPNVIACLNASIAPTKHEAGLSAATGWAFLWPGRLSNSIKGVSLQQRKYRWRMGRSES